MPDPRSVLTRAAPPPDLTIDYGPHPEHVADVRLPAHHGPAPLLIVVHGGFWRARYDRGHTGPQCAGFAAAGFAVASIEYRRSTGSPGAGGWPVTFDDVARAVDTVPGLVADAAPGRVDPGRIVHVGHSAGAQLAVWAASRHRLPRSSPWWRPRRPAITGAGDPPALRGVVSLAGVLDLVGAARDRLDDGAVQDFLGGEPDDVPERYAAADPSSLAPADVPVTLLHGSLDDRVPPMLSRRYADTARVAGATGAAGTAGVELVSLDGIEHFGLIDPESSAWPVVVDRVSASLRPLDGGEE